MTNLFENLMDKSMERIAKCLPENYEIDDVRWGNDEFMIPVFEFFYSPDGELLWDKQPEMVCYFHFSRKDNETNKEVKKRWKEEITEFNYRWEQ